MLIAILFFLHYATCCKSLNVIIKILFRYKHITEVSPFVHSVLSGNGQVDYTVHSRREGEVVEHTCTCASYIYHHNICKHIYAVRLYLKIESPIISAGNTSHKDKSCMRGRPRHVRPVKKRKKSDKGSESVQFG